MLESQTRSFLSLLSIRTAAAAERKNNNNIKMAWVFLLKLTMLTLISEVTPCSTREKSHKLFQPVSCLIAYSEAYSD